MKNLVPRILSGIIYMGLIILGTTGQSWLFAGLMGMFMLFCLIEYVRLTELSDKLYTVLMFIGSAGIFYFFSNYLFSQQSAFLLQSLSFIGPIMFLLAAFTILFSSNELYIEFGKATIGVIYIAVPFSLALTIPSISFELGKEIISNEILLIFLLIWFSDVMAYVAGSLFGKHKLAPKISKNKSWEGFFGGFISTIIVGTLLEFYVFPKSKLNWVIISTIIAICAPVGDLVESKLKRTFNAKDSGNFIPGHGGFLDRLDSFIFVVPMVYLYLLLNNIL
ncbi:MAG: phosphatidate cytidylyltransferase [Moheibacter sp.]